MASLPHETTVTKACHPYFTVSTLEAPYLGVPVNAEAL
jgi:hypothetical protein